MAKSFCKSKARCFHQASLLSMYTFHIVLIAFCIHQFLGILNAICCWRFDPFERIKEFPIHAT